MISIEYDQSDGYFSKLISLEKIIFNLDTKNIDESTQSIYDLFGAKYLNSVLLVISQLIYSSFSSQRKDFNLYFMFLKALDIKYEKITKYRTINIFIKYLQSLKSQESNYLLVKMFEQNMIDINVLIKKQCLYFVHYTKIDDIEDDFSDIFRRDIKIFRKNNWALHKKYIEEGHSPNEIAKIIRNDEEKKLQEISSQTNFDFNQTIEPSLYEIYSFINKRGVTLIDYAAFFGSVKCFKFLLLNGSNLKNTFKYAIAGDNLEIIHLCEQNHVSSKDVCKTAIKLHKSDVFEYFKGDLSYSNRFEENVF